MQQLPPCPQCNSTYTYMEQQNLVCPECGHEWQPSDSQHTDADEIQVKDAHGNILHAGDSVTVIKDLKVKGTSQVVKVGTKVKNIRINSSGDHDIDCKIPGIGAMQLKSEYVKKT